MFERKRACTRERFPSCETRMQCEASALGTLCFLFLPHSC
jgi:hypothetical protein